MTKTAFITGATAGIGEAAARRFARDGWHVIGTGRRAYGTGAGQVLVVVGIVAVAICWAWAGHLLRLPAEERVFRRHVAADTAGAAR